jgi:NitT/TauT family transport system substrate-binding protein
VAEGKAVMVDGAGFGSLYGSSRNADAFNVKNSVYKEKQDVESYIDPKITSGK